MTVKSLRDLSGMSQTQYAKYFCIPLSTLKKWEQGVRVPPVYVVLMMQRILIKDGLINV